MRRPSMSFIPAAASAEAVRISLSASQEATANKAAVKPSATRVLCARGGAAGGKASLQPEQVNGAWARTSKALASAERLFQMLVLAVARCVARLARRRLTRGFARLALGAAVVTAVLRVLIDVEMVAVGAHVLLQRLQPKMTWAK